MKLILLVWHHEYCGSRRSGGKRKPEDLLVVRYYLPTLSMKKKKKLPNQQRWHAKWNTYRSSVGGLLKECLLVGWGRA